MRGRHFLVFIWAGLLLAACTGPARGVLQSWAGATTATTDPESGTPYLTRNVLVRSGADDIASTLLLPTGSGPFAAVVWISGSGEGLEPADGPLPRRLVTHGIAVLMLGKKGVGASGGDWRRETFADRAANVEAALAWLARRPDIDSRRVGMYGHSQGAYIATIVAAHGARAAYAVLAAPSSQRVREQIATDYMYGRMRDEHLPRDAAQAAADRMLLMMDAAMSVCPLVRVHYLCGVYKYDPVPELQQVRIPVLALLGGRDTMVPPAENLDRLEKSLDRAGVPHIVKVFPEANHRFWISHRGTPSEYEELVRNRSAGFKHAQPGNPVHEQARQRWANRAAYVEGYFDTVLQFVQANGVVQAAGNDKSALRGPELSR